MSIRPFIFRIGPFVPLAESSIFGIPSFALEVFGLIQRADSKSCIDQDQISPIQFDSSFPYEKISIDFTGECRNEDPIIAAIDIVVISNNNLFIPIDSFSTARNYIIVLGQCFCQLFQVAFGNNGPFIDFMFVLKPSTEVLQKTFQLLDGYRQLSDQLLRYWKCNGLGISNSDTDQSQTKIKSVLFMFLFSNITFNIRKDFLHKKEIQKNITLHLNEQKQITFICGAILLLDGQGKQITKIYSFLIQQFPNYKSNKQIKTFYNIKSVYTMPNKKRNHENQWISPSKGLNQLQSGQNYQQQNNSYDHEGLDRNNTSQNNMNSNGFTKMNKGKSNLNRKHTLQSVLQEFESRLHHEIILKLQNSNQNDFERQVLRKLSQTLLQNLEENLSDIRKTEQKLQNPLLNHHSRQQIKQKILEIRMKELANIKVLVNTYKYHEYRLVLGSFHIARTYQDLKCHEQAITHLQNSIQMNEKFKGSNKDAHYFHSYLLTFEAQSQFSLQSEKLSLELLNRAMQIHEGLSEQSYDIDDFFTLNLTANVLSAVKNHSQALQMANEGLDSAQKNYSKESLQYAIGCKTLADVYVNTENFNEAIKSINQGIQVLKVSSPEKQQTIVEFYTKLSEITLKQLNSFSQDEKQNYLDQYIGILRQKYEVIEDAFGYRDKRAIKEKRHLASSLLKYYKIVQAEQELQDILEIEQVVYGQKSVQVAKTLKLLGTVAMSQSELKKAEKYLKKSQGIFHDQGYTNLQKQVQAKMLVLSGNAKFLQKNKN